MLLLLESVLRIDPRDSQEGLEVWVVPEKDLRLSQGIPLGLLPACRRERQSSHGRGEEFVVWCDRLSGEAAGWRGVSVSSLLQLLPEARRRFEDVLRWGEAEGNAAAEGYDFEGLRRLGGLVLCGSASGRVSLVQASADRISLELL